MDSRKLSGPFEARPKARAVAPGRVLAFNTPASSDRALVAGMAAREPAAAAELFDRYHDLVRGLLIRLLGRDDAEDLVQQTFVIVISKSAEIEKPEALRSYVVSVALRLAKNELRRRRLRRFLRLSDPCLPPLVSPEVAARDQVKAVYRALDELDPNSRVLFCLRYVEGWELSELAEAQSCSLATVKRKLRKARERFRVIAGRDPALRAYVEACE